MQVSADKFFLRLFLGVFVIWEGPSAFAKCRDISKEQYIAVTPIILKGTVLGLKKESRPAKQNPVLSFDIKVISLYKGKVDKESLHVEYDWVESKPPIRNFSESQTYIFGIGKVEGGTAIVDYSTCSPNLTEQDLAHFQSKKEIVGSEKMAIKLAETYLASIYGETVLKQRPFTASKDKGLWLVKGTLNCPSGQHCLGGVAEIWLKSANGEVVNYSHGK